MLRTKHITWGQEEYSYEARGLQLYDWPELYLYDLPLAIPFILPLTEWEPESYHVHQNQRVSTIEAVISGRLAVTVDGYDRCLLHPGEMVIIPCGRKNRIETVGSQPCTKLVIGVVGPLGGNLLSFCGFEPATVYPLHSVEQIQQELFELAQIYRRKDSARRNEAIGKSMTLLLDLRDQVFRKKGILSSELTMAMQLMEANILRNLSMDEFAAKLNLSPARLRFLFQEHLNTTPHRYLRELRMRKAEQLLHQSDIRIQEVAAQCGYSSAVRFIHAFTARHGISPRGYRIQLRKEQ